MTHFRVIPERSWVSIEARSNVGPIRWQGTGLEGFFEAELPQAAVDPGAPTAARLEVPLEHLRSGNALYDAELLRRMDARTYPRALAVLQHMDGTNTPNRYQLHGSITVHGVTRDATLAVILEVEDSTVTVHGEKVLDIRDFDIPSPSLLMLKILPDVRVRMVVEAELEA